MDESDDDIEWLEASSSMNIDTESRTPYSDAVKCKKLVNYVKRPMNPFMIWSQIERKKIWEQNPGIQAQDVSILLGKRWKMLTNQERIPFAKEAERLRQLHSQEFPNYKYSPKRRKKKSPKSVKKLTSPTAKSLKNKSDFNSEKSGNSAARDNLIGMKTKKCETGNVANSKLVSKNTSSVSSEDEEIDQSQVANSSKKVLRKNKFSEITFKGKPVWDSLMEVDIATLTSKKTLPPRLQIDNCLTSGSIAALSCYRDDWAAAFDYLTDKVLQSSKNIYEEIDSISKQYGETLEGKNVYPTEPLEFTIPDIQKELGKKWRDPNFGLRFSS